MDPQPDEPQVADAGAAGATEIGGLAKAVLLSSEKRTIIGFQVVVSIAVLGAYLSLPEGFVVPWQFYVAAGAYIASVLVFAFEPVKTFETKRSQFLVLLFSLAMLVTCLLLLGLSHKEFYLVLLLTIFMSAISKKASYAFLISVVMAGLYVVLLLNFAAGAGEGSLVTPALLIRMVVFFVVSSFVGHTSEVAETRKRDVEELIASRKKLEAFALEQDKMAAVGLLAAGVAHEFNNLLAGIKGYADLAKIDAVSHEEFVNVVSEQCRRAAGIVRDLLSFSRQRGDAPERTDVAGAVEQTLRLVQKELGAREIHLLKDVRRVRDVTAPPGVLGRIVLNLISNSIEAVQRGGEIAVTLDETGSEAVLAVRDNGCGMSAEDVHRAFEPFFSKKGEDSKRVAKAPGLGLAVSKHLVEKCGGAVSIESAPGKGTSVIVRLPNAPDQDARAPAGPLPREDGKAVPPKAPGPSDQGSLVASGARAEGEAREA